MSTKSLLKALFTCILVSLVIYTIWAGTRQSVFDWGGLTTGPDRYWTIATLMDAYFGFTTFYVWVFYKERGWIARIAWFLAIMLLGNMAMSSYVLLQLARLRSDQPATDLLLTRNPQPDRS
jgi:isoprenylcysteine carboxyl methyltransferase (ICMT) family protein YpbQ